MRQQINWLPSHAFEGSHEEDTTSLLRCLLQSPYDKRVKERLTLNILLLVDLRQIAELTQYFIQVKLICRVTLNHNTISVSMIALIDQTSCAVLRSYDILKNTLCIPKMLIGTPCHVPVKKKSHVIVYLLL